MTATTKEEFEQHKKQAEQYNRTYMILLAEDYEKGEGTEKNLFLAIQWYSAYLQRYSLSWYDPKDFEKVVKKLLALAISDSKEAAEKARETLLTDFPGDYGDRNLILSVADGLSKSPLDENKKAAINYYKKCYSLFRWYNDEANCQKVMRGLLAIAMTDSEEARKALKNVIRGASDRNIMLELADELSKSSSQENQKTAIYFYGECYSHFRWYNDEANCQKAMQGLLALALTGSEEARKALKNVIKEGTSRNIMLVLADGLSTSTLQENKEAAIYFYEKCYLHFRWYNDEANCQKAMQGLLALALTGSEEARKALKNVIKEGTSRNIMLVLADGLSTSTLQENKEAAIYFYGKCYPLFRWYSDTANAKKAIKGLVSLVLQGDAKAKAELNTIIKEEFDYHLLLDVISQSKEIVSLESQKIAVDLYYKVFSELSWGDTHYWQKTRQLIANIASQPNQNNQHHEIIIYAKLKLANTYWRQWARYGDDFSALQKAYDTTREAFDLTPPGVTFNMPDCLMGGLPETTKECFKLLAQGDDEGAAQLLTERLSQTKAVEKFAAAFFYQIAGEAFQKTSQIDKALESYTQAYECLQTYAGKLKSEAIIQRLCSLTTDILKSNDMQLRGKHCVILARCLETENNPTILVMLNESLQALFHTPLAFHRSEWLTLTDHLTTAMKRVRGQSHTIIKPVVSVFKEFESRVAAIKDKQTVIALSDKLAVFYESLGNREQSLAYREQAYRLSATSHMQAYPDINVLPESEAATTSKKINHREKYVDALMRDQDKRKVSETETAALAELMREGPLPNDAHTLSSLGDRFIRAEKFDVAATCYLAMVDKQEIPLLIRLSKLEVLKKLVTGLSQAEQEKIGIGKLNEQIVIKATELEKEFLQMKEAWRKKQVTVSTPSKEKKEKEVSKFSLFSKKTKSTEAKPSLSPLTAANVGPLHGFPEKEQEAEERKQAEIQKEKENIVLTHRETMEFNKLIEQVDMSFKTAEKKVAQKTAQKKQTAPVVKKEPTSKMFLVKKKEKEVQSAKTPARKIIKQ